MNSTTNTPCGAIGCPCEGFDGPASAKSSTKCRNCHHTRFHHKAMQHEGDVPFPDYWMSSKQSASSSSMQAIVDLQANAIDEFQRVIDKTHLGKWTRDRTKHNPTNPRVPSSFKVTAVRRNENSE